MYIHVYTCTCRNPEVKDHILPNVLEMIGSTPLVRLDKIARREGLKCELRKSTVYTHVITYVMYMYMYVSTCIYTFTHK